MPVTAPFMETLASSCLAGVFLAGCATTRPASSWQRTGDPVADGKAAVEHGPGAAVGGHPPGGGLDEPVEARVGRLAVARLRVVDVGQDGAHGRLR